MPAGSKTIKNYALGHYFVASFFQTIYKLVKKIGFDHKTKPYLKLNSSA